MHSGRAFYPSRERIDHGKDALYLQSVERLTIAVDIELMLTVFLGIEPFHIAVESLIVQNAIVVGFKREHIHGHHVDVYLTVLHTSAITALIFVVHLWLVFHNYLVVLVKIDLTTFSHFTQFGLAPPPLYTYVLVHLGFEHAEFVEFSLRSHSKPSVTPGTLFETGPEIRELVDDGRIITYGSLEVTDAVEQQGTVVDGHEVGGLHAHHIVKVLHGTIVIAQLNTDKASIVMSQEVVGIQFEGLIIVVHHTAEIIRIDATERTVHVAVDVCRLQSQHFGKEAVSLFPLLLAHCHISASCPGVSIVWVNL